MLLECPPQASNRVLAVDGEHSAVERARALLQAHPDITGITIFFSDLNGIPRGKRLPVDHLLKAFSGGVRMPLSSLCLDVWGTDVPEMAMASGDADGVCLPTERGLLPVPWRQPTGAYLPMSLYHDDHTPCPGDPRHALARVLANYRARGLTPVVAVELEFYLLDPAGGRPQSPCSPVSGKRLRFDNLHSVDELENFGGFIDDVYAACAAQDVSADTALVEFGAGQFEINLKHVPDALRAADEAVALKRIVRGVARQHGYAATFMAKPYAERSGSGCHVHFSVLDAHGVNIFADGSDAGSAALGHAVSGLLSSLADLMSVFAPHLNSYRRLRSESYAPTIPVWGYENRTTALRIPAGDPDAKRVEHRVAGADANPYLVVAAILGAALQGLCAESAPPAPITGNAYASDTPAIESGWHQSLALFEHSPLVKALFDPLMMRMLLALKHQEMRRFSNQITEFELNSYLDTV